MASALTTLAGALAFAATLLAHGAVPAGATDVQVMAPPDEMLKVRDPFKRPDIEISQEEPKSDLEKYPVDGFKMIGVLTGPRFVKAMLLGPDGKTYLVTEKMKIGQRSGVIRKITTDAVLVREKIVNVLGQEENLDIELHLIDVKKDTASK